MRPTTSQRARQLTSSVWSRLAAHRQGFRVYWWSSWSDELEAALGALPESADCTHELYRLLVRNPSAAHKQTALVMRGSEPVAVAGIRRRANDWVPVTHYVVPGIIFPHKPGYLGAVLAALGVDLAIGWWRMQAPPPRIAGMRALERIPTFVMPLQEDWERHWSKNQRKCVRRARKKCEHLCLRVNDPGAAEWTVRQSEARWRVSSGREDPGLADRLAAVRYFEDIGRHITLTLVDGDRPASGNTLLRHGNTVVNQFTCRLPEYDGHEVGHALLDLTFRWSADQGYEALDLGGAFGDYKSRWAPEAGAKYSFSVCPAGLHHLQRARATIAAVRRNGLAAAARAVGRRLARVAGLFNAPLSVLSPVLLDL
jgi:hypothetical protein